MAKIALYVVVLWCSLGIMACQTVVPRYAGDQLFVANCSSCHGVLGEGDGPVAQVLTIPITDLRLLSIRNGGVFPRELVGMIIDGRELRVAHGVREMPVWGEEFLLMEGFDPAAERRVSAKIDALVEHLATLQVQD